jgi:hypothetical protein
MAMERGWIRPWMASARVMGMSSGVEGSHADSNPLTATAGPIEQAPRAGFA